ncbi:MAG: M50 family metallopeptidase, partial [Planctomycetota bacterium]|nr:M50 family metallopeptidase [Planctomycetota bacterium]
MKESGARISSGRAATGRRWLVMLAAFVIACNWSRILHEFGHVTAALATGGRAGEVRVSPVSWSYAYCQSPSPRIVRWGGFALQTVGGVVVLGLAWLLAKRWSLIGILFALLALNGAGSYMIAGVLTGVG